MVEPLGQNLFCILESFCGIKKTGKRFLKFLEKEAALVCLHYVCNSVPATRLGV